MRQAAKTAAVTIYGLGTAAAGILLGLFVSRCGVMLFPEAMLPIQLWELSSLGLAFGSIPMLTASVFFYRAFQISQGGHRIRNTICTFLPAALCLCFLVFWIGVLAAGAVGLELRAWNGHGVQDPLNVLPPAAVSLGFAASWIGFWVLCFTGLALAS